MLPAMPSMPLNLSSSSSAKSGDVGAPNTVYFGSTGGGTDVAALVRQYWPLLAGTALVLVIMRKKG